ncbi:MAG: hypothetical protein Q4B69_03575 [Slackia sp.]|nr:hypothetical protein [Slackia sp.]
MDDPLRRALSRILFFDATTPLDELIEHARANPVTLDAAEAAALVDSELFSLWPEQQGCALLAADLHALARDAKLPDEGLILHLPQAFGDMPLTRIAREAFRPWLSYGIKIRLLILPEGMTDISDGALAPLCFEHLCLPSTLTHFGMREVRWNKLTCYPDRVSFSVHGDNPAFAAHDGSLYSKDGTELIAHAYPYDACIDIPDGVKRLRKDAFIHTPQPPQSILCPDNLEEAPDEIDPSLLWIRNSTAPVAQLLRREGRLGVSPVYWREDGCVFDFNPARSESVLVSAQGNDGGDIVLPASVVDRPLTRIGERALPRRAQSVALSENVKIVEDGNACEGAQRIVLNEGLASIGAGCFMRAAHDAAVRIPRSVQSIGARSFCASRIFFEALGTAVFIPAGSHSLFEPQTYRTTGFSRIEYARRDADGAFTAPFDMGAYDGFLAGDRSFFGKTEAIVDRLSGDVEISQEHAIAFAAQLDKNADSALCLIAQRRSKRCVERLAEHRFYENEQRFLAQCELLRQHHATEALGLLMEQRVHHGNVAPAKPSDRFAF